MFVLIFVVLLYLPLFLRSFLCPAHPHVLNVYFGVPGSGKTTFAAYLTRWALHENALIRFCRRHRNWLTTLLLNSKYLKRRIDVYSNVPITGAYRLDAKVVNLKPPAAMDGLGKLFVLQKLRPVVGGDGFELFPEIRLGALQRVKNFPD